jgi:hypothetical protein
MRKTNSDIARINAQNVRVLNEKCEQLFADLTDWKRLFCGLALEYGGELRVSQLSMAKVLGPNAKTTFETYTDPATGDRIFRIVPEQSKEPDNAPCNA